MKNNSQIQSITRRGFLASALAAFAGTRTASHAQDNPAPRPNILMILSDDLGWNDVGWHNASVRTPNLDRLAARAVKFEQYRVNAVCSPTRSSLLTGRTCFRVGVPNPISQGMALPATEKLMPQMLAGAGYQTWLVGKWHLGDIATQYLPMQRGFQYHYGFLGGEVDYWKHTTGNSTDWYRNGVPLAEDGYTTDLIAADAIRLIQARDTSKPFYLDLSFNAPHTPLEGREPFLSDFAAITDDKRKNYLSMVEDMDGAIGRVYDALEQEGIADNTLLIWMSDNGGQTTGGGASNTPLKGLKGDAWEGGIRVPAFALWPKVLDGGRVFDKFFTVLDWLPTLAEVTGMQLDPGIELDGVNMWGSLTRGESAVRSYSILGGGTNYAVFKGDFKLVEQSVPKGPSQRTLYQIFDDPAETRDVSVDNPDVMSELVKILQNQPVGVADTSATTAASATHPMACKIFSVSSCRPSFVE